MKEVNIFLSILIIIILVWTLLLVLHDTRKTSSPVEEMYHKQLVVTIDSILDARSCVEPIDSDDITLQHDQFGRVIIPSDHR